MAHTHDTKRDRTRRLEAKLASMTRRQQRIAKSAQMFLAIAFPADIRA